MIIDMDDNLKHYGMPRRSGRYPWGSGEDPYQSEQDTFLKDVTELQKNGMSEVDIAKKHNMSTTELRSRISIAKNEAKKRDYYEAIKLRNKGMSYQAIADKLGMPNESSVRSLLAPSRQEKLESISKTADILKKSVDEKGYIDVGLGVETTIGVSSTKMNTAIKKLEDEGYIITNIPVEQLGTGKNTTVKVLMKKPEGASDSDISRKAFALAAQNKDKISLPMGYIEHETGKTKYGLDPIQSIDKSRVLIRYAEDGGIKKDGVIELRRNVGDLDLGASRYAQVRIGVDGTHYFPLVVFRNGNKTFSPYTVTSNLVFVKYKESIFYLFILFNVIPRINYDFDFIWIRFRMFYIQIKFEKLFVPLFQISLHGGCDNIQLSGIFNRF